MLHWDIVGIAHVAEEGAFLPESTEALVSYCCFSECSKIDNWRLLEKVGTVHDDLEPVAMVSSDEPVMMDDWMMIGFTF